MIKLIYLVVASVLFLAVNCSQPTNSEGSTVKALSSQAVQNKKQCTWCGASEAPDDVSWRTIIVSENEPGDKLIVSGTVFLPDGKTPAEGVIVYVYHTNIKGVYPKRGNEKGNGKYHGYLRGWMKTDSKGRYEFETIRPAPYHTHGGEPAHIHYTVMGGGYSEYWLDALWFDDDARVTEEYKKSVTRSGGFSNVTTLTRDENNVLRGERNIILKKYD